MADEHIFVASGDSCPICTGLSGMLVPSGYTAHPNCHCQTIPREESESCTYTVLHSDTHRDGSGPNDAIYEYEVEVLCPDGSSAAASNYVDLHTYGGSDAELDRMLDDISDAIDHFAQSICDSCPPAKPVS